MKRAICCFLTLIFVLILGGCFGNDVDTNSNADNITIENLPSFYGMAYVEINNNIPQFSKDEITAESFEKYSALDYLSRCGTASACVGVDIMPTEERGEIGMVKPTGWHTVKYDVVDGKYLYNRCHLIGYQLTGENANEQNLITGTRFLNIEGMLPFENMIADYVKETNNHVMYRVTPFFEGVNLLCKGVQIEGYSVEDDGDGISFNVFAYNAQPQIEINYLTGESTLISNMLPDEESSVNTSYSNEITTTESYVESISNEVLYNEQPQTNAKCIINKNTKKIHLETCQHAKKIKKENREEHKGDLNEYIKKGYALCQVCFKSN